MFQIRCPAYRLTVLATPVNDFPRPQHWQSGLAEGVTICGAADGSGNGDRIALIYPSR